METTNVTQEAGSPYTWASSFTWSDYQAFKLWSELYPSIYGLSVDGDILLDDTPENNVTKLLFENGSIVDFNNRDIQQLFKETLYIAETYTDFISFMLKVVESFNAIDSAIKESGKLSKERILLSDKRKIDTNKAINESIIVSELYKDIVEFIRKYAESFGTSDNITKNIKALKKDAIKVNDKRLFAANKAIVQNLAMSESYKKTTKYKRMYSEYVSFADKLAKDLTISKSEAFRLMSIYFRHANAVLSDIALSNKDMTLEQFIDRVSSPVGYDKFIDFIPGEYEYQKAIVQLILETVSTNTTVPQVTDWVFNVDIPDTVDRGSATLTANTPLTIPFNRKFYHVPEVNVTVKSGNNISAFPQITDITEINFTVVSTDSCTISWTAVGY